MRLGWPKPVNFVILIPLQFGVVMDDLNEFPRVALCVLKILDRHCTHLPSSDGDFYTTVVSLAPQDLDGRLCAGLKRFNLDSLAPHSPMVGVSPLMAALLTQQFALVEQMLAKGARINHSNADNVTPLLAVCSLADPDTVMWCAQYCSEQEWKRTTGCYDPYGSEIPLQRLRHVAPILAQAVQDSWEGQGARPKNN